jgi:ADP-ribose pyrophosphatase YjhB (NUDIX family)
LEGQWTVPWGRLEKGESPVAAAVRETKEEAGIQAVVEGLLGVQELPPPWQGWIAIVYLCRHAAGELHPEDGETDAAGYYSLSELNALEEPVEPWSDWLVRRVFSGGLTVTHRDPTNPFRHDGAFL